MVPLDSHPRPRAIMNARTLRHALIVISVCVPTACRAQSPELVYIANVTAIGPDGRAPTTIEEQTEAALDSLGRALARRGLDYSDVVVSNVFLSDARHLQGMNQVYRGYFETDPPTRATVQADLVEPDALVQISVVATGGEKEVVSPTGLMSPALPYSWGIRVGNTLFIAGATSRDPGTYDPLTGDVPTQTRRIFGNIGLVLQEAGMDYDDLVSCKVFLDDARRFQEMNGAYAEFVPETDPPARATVRAELMNVAFSTEIQCVAVSSVQRALVRPEARGASPYSPAIDTGDRVYVAGVTGRGADAEEEARTALGSIGMTLDAASLGFGDVEEVWVYLADVRERGAVADVLAEVMGPGAPEPTVVVTRTMGRAIVEIQVTATRLGRSPRP